MEKEPSPKVIVTFPNTTTALAMEAACKAGGVPGRIIPVPNRISAGCGFAWCAEGEERQRISAFLQSEALVYSELHLIDL